MAEIILFHHALGRTEGMLAFAETITRAGHTVHVPDLYEGHRFDTIPSGVAYANTVGFEAIVESGVQAVQSLPEDLIYAGFSMGVIPAQKLAQTRQGARGALLFDACVPFTEFGANWPQTVPVDVHGMDADPYFAGEGDLATAQALVADFDGARLFLYSGDQHIFADSSLSSYNVDAAALLIHRVLLFLEEHGCG